MSAAFFSPCGRYRYRLERDWTTPLGGTTASVLFVMLNPSTATGSEDDPTIRRCIGFAQSWGYSGLLVGNLFAYRATDPDLLPAGEEAEGPENDEHLIALAAQAELVVAAWGTHRRAAWRAERVRGLLDGFLGAGKLSVLGLTKHGHPKHPLYVAHATRPAPWPR